MFDKVWDEIVFDLQGTCQSLELVLDSHNKLELENNDDFLYYLDNQLFCCTCCNWWNPLSEASEINDYICNDCAEEDSED